MNLKQIGKRILPAALFALALASTAAAQPFQLQFIDGPITTGIANDSILTLAAPLGQSKTLQMRAIYRGTGVVTIAQPPSIAGSSTFTVSMTQALPLTLNPDDTLFFTVRFGPISPAVETARLTIPFAESPASTITPLTLNLQGVTSAITVSYILPEDNNNVAVQTGATIPFPETLVGGASPATLNFTNIGSTAGQVTKVSVSGAAFRLHGLPLFPATVLAGQSIQVQVLFRPAAPGPSTGIVTIEIAAADPITLNLEGNATAPKLTYEQGNPASPVLPGGTFTLPDTAVGQSGTARVRVTNTGSAGVGITTIFTIGASFQISNGPVLPLTLAANASVEFTVTFAPGQTGAQTGTLIVNSDVFNLSGNGLGPLLTFSYISGGATIQLGNGNNSVIFSPVRITESAQLGLDITNTGTTAAPIQNIGIGQTGSAYSIVNPPAFPVSIAPNTTLRVTLQFEPVVVGFASTTLIVDNAAITLTGSGTAPPALPAYTLSGPTGSAAPLTQPNVSLKLASPYPVALTGTLTLAAAAGNLPSDPAVQFATGGRTVSFRIPANSTDAIFGTLGTQVGLQTGTVAGTVTLTPSFATQAGVDLTPSAPATLQFTVDAAAPSLLSMQIVNPTSTGFTVQLTGFTTTRTLTGLNIQFTTASGFQMPNSQFAIDLKSIAATWFQSTASQAFGGQFRVSIPFSFQLPEDKSVLTGITSVSATASNEPGTSTALQARIQ